MDELGAGALLSKVALQVNRSANGELLNPAQR